MEPANLLAEEKDEDLLRIKLLPLVLFGKNFFYVTI